MGRKFGGGLRPLFGEEERGPHLTQSRLRRGYLYTKWHLDPCSHLAATDMSRKLKGCAPFAGGGATVEAYVHAKFHLDPSNRLATIHQRYRQDRTDRTGQKDIQRSDSIGRNVLQTVAQKVLCFM